MQFWKHLSLMLSSRYNIYGENMKKSIIIINYMVIACGSVIMILYCAVQINRILTAMMLLCTSLVSWINTYRYYKYKNKEHAEEIRFLYKCHPLQVSIFLTVGFIALALL